MVETGWVAGICLCGQLIQSPTMSRAQTSWDRSVCTHSGVDLRTSDVKKADSVGPSSGRKNKHGPEILNSFSIFLPY